LKKHLALANAIKPSRTSTKQRQRPNYIFAMK
jgi:hypothetical protein